MSESGAWYDSIKTPEQQLKAQPHFSQPEFTGEAAAKTVTPLPMNLLTAMTACDISKTPAGAAACTTALRTAFQDVDGSEGAMPHLLALQDRKDGIRSSLDTSVRNGTIAAGGDIYNTDLGQVAGLTNQQENQVAARYQMALEVSQTQPNNPLVALQSRQWLTQASQLQARIDDADHSGDNTPTQIAIQGALEQQSRGAINPLTVIPEGLVHAAFSQMSWIPGFSNETQAHDLLRAAYRLDPSATETAVRLQGQASLRPGLSTMLADIKADSARQANIRAGWQPFRVN